MSRHHNPVHNSLQQESPTATKFVVMFYTLILYTYRVVGWLAAATDKALLALFKTQTTSFS